jgi:hypothetical protein
MFPWAQLLLNSCKRKFDGDPIPIKNSLIMRKPGLFSIIVFIYFILLHFTAAGQFQITAEIRPRGEIDNGALVPLVDTSTTRYYVSQRTRLSFDFQKTNFHLRLTAQDVRIWGSGDIYTGTGVFGSTSGLDFHEAWLKINLLKNTSLKIGRQILSYDNQRLISKRNWNQFGVAYDALLIKHRQPGWDFDIALSYNTFMNNNTGKPDFSNQLFLNTNLMKTFNFLRMGKSFGEHIESSLYLIAAGFTNENNPDVIYITGTYGLYTKMAYNHFELPVDAYYQNGKAQTGKDVAAFAIGINPKVSIGSFKIGLGADYLSGDDANNSDYQKKEKTFNKFYGGGFRYHGWMNYYVYIKGSTKNGGLVDIFPNISWKISSVHKLDIQAHFFSLANSVLVDDHILNDKNLGTEIDTRYTFTLNEEFNLNIGCSYYFTTDTFIKVKTGFDASISQPYWIWTMLTYTPDIFRKD